MARRLGVTPEVLEAARQLTEERARREARSPDPLGGNGPSKKGDRLVQIALPWFVHDWLTEHGRLLQTDRGVIVRSCLHYWLSRASDPPVPQPDAWVIDGQRHLMPRRGGPKVGFRVPMGALAALESRRKSARTRQASYVRRCLIAYMEGKPPVVQLVQTEDLWNDPARYFLRARNAPLPPETDQ